MGRTNYLILKRWYRWDHWDHKNAIYKSMSKIEFMGIVINLKTALAYGKNMVPLVPLVPPYNIYNKYSYLYYYLMGPLCLILGPVGPLRLTPNGASRFPLWWHLDLLVFHQVEFPRFSLDGFWALAIILKGGGESMIDSMLQISRVLFQCLL